MNGTTAELKEMIRQKAVALGFTAAGFSAIRPQHDAGLRLKQMIAEGRHGEMKWLETRMQEREDPRLLLEGAATVISAAMRYAAFPPEHAGSRSSGISRYAVITDYHRVVASALQELLDFIRSHARRPVAGRVCVDGAPVFEKAWAEKSGLGRIGKNTLLIVPSAGSGVFLGELLLDLELKPDEPSPLDDPCGNCTNCIDHCPTGALTAPGRIDATRCISWLTIELKREFTAEEAAMIGHRLFGCDRCQEACPHNRQENKAPLHTAFAPRRELLDLTPEAVLTLTGSGFRKLFAGTPIERLGLRRLKRNAHAVFENR